MNLDPVDIFGETIGGPLKRGALFFAAAVMGGWIGEYSCLVDIGEWSGIGWQQISDGFLWPLWVLLSSAAPLVIAACIVFLLASRWLEWIWCLTAAGISAIVLYQHEADIGWIAWFVLNAGIAGLVWLHMTWRRARWASELFELNAENAIRNRMRTEQPPPGPEEPGEQPRIAPDGDPLPAPRPEATGNP